MVCNLFLNYIKPKLPKGKLLLKTNTKHKIFSCNSHNVDKYFIPCIESFGACSFCQRGYIGAEYLIEDGVVVPADSIAINTTDNIIHLKYLPLFTESLLSPFSAKALKLQPLIHISTLSQINRIPEWQPMAENELQLIV